ncbi:lysophosphatidylserine lipase ABHD12-like isoform X1 [Entelurus aequoreus]|uniref:lysophosphatidylserine lipase ABHD12-like isoform X1 n=1 Tax=Entelurus aequoreus TaxID=161455 RepID=UPI002B1DE406|nr:lysophosphatidylserine lipase ABHD12-like isoform X1 [Entelurus aequoreus]XP_061897171.1 lysophosphatidylserine lipase ABHD12-like isoform X1 [Entelurus aequoreus]XP_061897172.1 lysophosphatidylserine lipase ABHD12-like isoform X1 [Entelurus aequoreus]
MLVMKTAVSFLIAAYVSTPVLLYALPWTLGYAIFAHLLRIPLFVDLGRPENILNHTSNFYLHTEEGITVGVWHTLPASQWGEAAGKSPEWYREALGDGSPVIVYLHGNVGNRAKGHRVQLVKILSRGGFHVLSLDYRGFGDSTGVPTESGLTTDALYLYKWVKRHSRRSLVYLWGHSLGSGVASNTAVKLQEEGSTLDALILEAAFTKIGEVVTVFPLSKLYMFLPGFEDFLWDTLETNNLLFANDENVKALTCPLLILHAEDDDVVPYHMGQKLYQIAARVRKERHSNVKLEMISYEASHGYSHCDIHLDPNLSKSVREFLNLRG